MNIVNPNTMSEEESRAWLRLRPLTADGEPMPWHESSANDLLWSLSKYLQENA